MNLKSILFCLFASFVLINCESNGNKEHLSDASPETDEKPEWTMVIHGGAGTITKDRMTPEKEAAFNEVLNEALNIGSRVLANGGSSLDAVEATIRYMEDIPLFNAGKGAVFTNAGVNELDASIMDGRTLEAGAVAGITTIKHPISAARAVMEQSNHVMLSGNGAEIFAESAGLELVDPSYFYTEGRYESLQKAIDRDKADKNGTVGAVALDKEGNLAAATSTGGMTNKRWGRIGDSPVIGAGTYANNATCAISCTGHGEYYIRYAVAHDVSAAMEYGGMSLQDAAKNIIFNKLNAKAGNGGLIGLDKNGNIAMTFNSEGMYRGYVTPDKREVLIYK
jgi:beta-aspartyl-peptidase (threonine type)